MVGLVVVGHGRLSEEMVQTLESVVGHAATASKPSTTAPDDGPRGDPGAHRRGGAARRPRARRPHPHRHARRHADEPEPGGRARDRRARWSPASTCRC